MKYRPKTWKGTLLIVAAVVAAIAAARFFGIGTFRSAIRVGYTGSEGQDSWSASYILLDGWLERTLRLGDTPVTLHIRTETDSGSISVRITDPGGRLLFDENCMENASFDLEASGSVIVRITAENHTGGFEIST